jgi:hypothetical protein
MYGGRIVAVVDGPSADKNDVGLLMATGGDRNLAEHTHVMETIA